MEVERRASDPRLQLIEQRIDDLETNLEANTKLTAEVHAIIGHAKGFFAVLGVVGDVVKWCAGIVVTVAAAWAIWTGKGSGS